MITIILPKWFVIAFSIYYAIAYYPNIIEGWNLLITDIKHFLLTK